MMNDAKEAEDVLQEGFTYIWRKAATYDPIRSSPFAWAVMITRNKAIDRLRVRQRLEKLREKVTSEESFYQDKDETSATNRLFANEVSWSVPLSSRSLRSNDKRWNSPFSGD